MLIQWYPGHMTKAMRMMQESVKLVDSVIYVLDCRAISSCINAEFDKLIGDKPVLYVLNKCDMVEKADLKVWVDYLTKNNITFIINNSTSAKNKNEIIFKLKKINHEKIDRYAKKGVKTSVRAMVVGVPNSGKSTLINSLCGGKKTITGDRPGVTRGKQWVMLAEGVELLDTPGTLPPNIKNQTHALHLAFIGSIKEDILDIQELAFEIIKFLKENYPTKIVERYNVEILEDNYEMFLSIGKSRGFIFKGGKIDTERTSKGIIDDFKKQRIGKLILDRPED